jgi:hypothetical protein
MSSRLQGLHSKTIIFSETRYKNFKSQFNHKEIITGANSNASVKLINIQKGTGPKNLQ